MLINWEKYPQIPEKYLLVSGVYSITCTPTKEEYIGRASSIARRWREHIQQLRVGRHINQRLQTKWKEHGEEAFAFRVLIICDPNDTPFYEKACIDGLRPALNIAKAFVYGYVPPPPRRPVARVPKNLAKDKKCIRCGEEFRTLVGYAYCTRCRQAMLYAMNKNGYFSGKSVQAGKITAMVQ